VPEAIASGTASWRVVGARSRSLQSSRTGTPAREYAAGMATLAARILGDKTLSAPARKERHERAVVDYAYNSDVVYSVVDHTLRATWTMR